MRRIHLNIGKLFSGRRGVAACLVLAAMIFGVVNLPWAVGVAATARQLPIYCVQRDQKMVSLSFDAAWGNVRVRYVCQHAFIN